MDGISRLRRGFLVACYFSYVGMQVNAGCLQRIGFKNMRSALGIMLSLLGLLMVPSSPVFAPETPAVRLTLRVSISATIVVALKTSF